MNETPAQKCARLVSALEDLTSQEAATMQALDFSAAITIQDRAAPLVDLLVAHAPSVTDPSVRVRITEVLAKRSRTGEWLAERLAQLREELQQTQVAQRRVAQVAPAYGRPVNAAARSQLSAVG